MPRDVDGVPLVVSERSLNAYGEDVAGGEAEHSRVGRILGHLLTGLLLGGLLVGAAKLGFGARKPGALRTAARWTVAAAGSLWGLLTGALGLILLGLWTLTDHEFAWNNENLLQANPLALGLVVLVPLAVAGGGSRWATRLAGLLVGLSLFGLFLHPLPVTPQANLAIIALGLFYAVWRAEGARPVRRPTAPGD